MNKINTIEELLEFLDKEITMNQVAKTDLLTKYHRESIIDKIIVQLKKGKISEITISDLEKVMENFGIEEYDLFLKLKKVLDKYDMSEYLTSSAVTKEGFATSRDDAIKYILTFVSDLQELLKDKNILEEETISELETQGIETDVIDAFRRILITILRELEIKRILETKEYKQLYQNVKDLTNIYTLLKECTERLLTQEEKDKIYNYLINSTIDDKLTIYTTLVSIWLEKARTLSIMKIVEPESIIQLEEPITPEIIRKVEDNLVAQKEEVQTQTNKRTKEDWIRLFEETINRINETTKLTSAQKKILEKIILNSLKISQEDLNLYEELLSFHEEISLDGRKQAYSDLKDFDESAHGTISIDLALNLIPNLEIVDLSEISKIIEYILDKYNQCYLSQEEILELSELIRTIQENYPDLSYIQYTDERKRYLEERFEELDGDKERLIKAASYNNSQLEEGYDLFIENTFKKIIKTKLDEIISLLTTNSKDIDQIKKDKIPNLRNQLEYWINKYSEYSITKEMKEPYHQYTIEEIQNIDFGNKNLIVFLNGKNGKKLYEEGLLNNGLNKNGKIGPQNKKVLQSIMKNCVNGGIEILSSYSSFKDYVYKPTSTNSSSTIHSKGDPVKISDHNLYRLSEASTPVRITIIALNLPDINKNKIGMSHTNTVVLVLSGYEVNRQNESKDYANMRREAEKYESEIKTIIDVFENPQTPKETLLKYIANSYGLLEKILGGESPQPQQPKRGGKQQ